MDAGEAGRDHLHRLTEALSAADGAELQSLRSERALLPLAGTRLAPPIRRSGLIVSLEQDTEHLPQPFIKSANTLVGPDERIQLPQHLGGQTALVGQIAAVLARPCHRLAAGDTHGAIGGYVLALDVTHASEPENSGGEARLMERVLGKQLPGFYPMGPYLVSTDELAEAQIQLALTINGVAAGGWSAGKLLPRVQEALVWLSRYFSFKPGDVVAIGAADAVGAVVGPGDEVRWSADGLGELRLAIGA